MNVLVIAGTSSGAGKTTLACALLARLPGWGAVKASEPHGRGPSLVEETAATARPGSDTARYLAAGAARAWWLRARPRDLPALAPAVLSAAAGLPGLLVEGNRAAGPFGGRVVLVAHAAREEVKPSARALLRSADAFVLNAPRALGPLHAAGWSVRLKGALAADLDDPGDPAREALLYGLISTLTWNAVASGIRPFTKSNTSE